MWLAERGAGAIPELHQPMTTTPDGIGDRTGGVTPRAVVIALLLLVAVAVGAFYVEIAWRRVYMFGAGVPSMASVALLFLLTALMSTRWLRRAGLRRRELLVIYGIVLVGGPLVSHGTLFWMIPKCIAYYEGARINLLWQKVFLPIVPPWFAPSDAVAVESFFEGHARVPWSLWWLPLGVWGGFMFCLFISTFCLLVLLQRQWISSERLSFPIAQLPLEMVRGAGADEDRGAGRLPGTWAFWVGLGIAFTLTFMGTLSSKVPAIPSIPLYAVLMQRVPVGPLAGLGDITVALWPDQIAIAYLIPKELAFSAWFFWVIRVGLTVIAIAAGATPQSPEGWYESTFPAPYFQGGGAAFALAIWVLWIARHHLARVLRFAFRGARGDLDTNEPMSYRLAVIGFLVSFGLMVYFCWAAGCRLVFGVVLIALIVGYYVMWARLRAETGLGFLPFPLEIQNALTSPFGSAIFRPKEIITMISTRWAFFPGFGESSEVIAGNVLEAFKIGDSGRVHPRRLGWALVAGFLFSLVVGCYLVLTGIYHYGYSSLGMGSAYGWPSWQTRNDGGRIFEYLTNPGKADPSGAIAFGAGAAVAVILGMLRLRFWWWPFHPIGYVAANCWGMQEYWGPFFIGWLAKTLVIRYGGLRLYRLTVPLAIGFMIGPSLNGGVWSIIELFVKGRL